jgi:hypothetical protein
VDLKTQQEVMRHTQSQDHDRCLHARRQLVEPGGERKVVEMIQPRKKKKAS